MGFFFQEARALFENVGQENEEVKSAAMPFARWLLDHKVSKHKSQVSQVGVKEELTRDPSFNALNHVQYASLYSIFGLLHSEAKCLAVH